MPEGRQSIRQHTSGIEAILTMLQSFCVLYWNNARAGVTTKEISPIQPSQARVNAAEEGMEAQVFIVVSHGITSRWDAVPVTLVVIYTDRLSSLLYCRAFTMMWCHYSPEWFDSSFNFPNCAVRILDSSIPGWDGGGLFGGFAR